MSKRGHGEGSVRERHDGRWESRLTYWRGGQPRRKSFYGTMRKEVAANLAAAQAALAQGSALAPSDKVTVAHFLADWLRAAEPPVRPKTHAGYESIVRTRIIPHLEHLGKVTALDVQRLYGDLDAAELAQRTVNHTYRVLKRTATLAVHWNLNRRNPCEGATPPRPERRVMEPLAPTRASSSSRLCGSTPATPSMFRLSRPECARVSS